MPPTRKPAHLRQNRVTKDVGLVVNPHAETPPAPCRLRKAAARAWQAYWTSDVAGATDGADLSMVERWIKNVNRYEALMAQADRTPIVAGSTGQPKANPLYDAGLALERAIKADEQQMGIGPLNRVKLGLVIGEAHRSLADLNAEVDDVDDDPRAALTAVAERTDGSALA